MVCAQCVRDQTNVLGRPCADCFTGSFFRDEYGRRETRRRGHFGTCHKGTDRLCLEAGDTVRPLQEEPTLRRAPFWVSIPSRSTIQGYELATDGEGFARHPIMVFNVMLPIQLDESFKAVTKSAVHNQDGPRRVGLACAKNPNSRSHKTK